ncbi:MAG: ABC transporter ATP-binding protein [Gemmatimonadota bacterium]|nr:ABC transporter ATP-binding protein [Gemmatimonadota bacterium]
MVCVEDLWKKYPGAWALRGVSLTVARGRVLGVLGENGSGKSTLFRILAGLTRSTRGQARIGETPTGFATKPVVAYLPEVDPFYPRMGVGEQLAFLSAFHATWNAERARRLLEFMNLPEDRRVGALSRGQRARLKVVSAFSWSSEVVLMDEPLGGIDPPSRRRILNSLFGEFRNPEQTILISTHLVSEVEPFIEDVLLLRDGEVFVAGQKDRLQEEHGKSLSEIFETAVA